MKIAPPTDNEVRRLKALYDYDVLDTEAEKVFDDLTLLTSQVCDKPITLISLVDPNRQWFKSKVGLDAQETSRDIAFCAHAIHQKEVFEVEDTLTDQRFHDNPLVTGEPNIRFYAGTPLVSPEGYAIGTLCVIDEKPNKLTVQQRQSLEVLGRSVISQMELRKNIKQLKLANEHKTEFLSNMSHELRTPLNAIIGFSRLILDDIRHQKLPNKFNEYLRHLDYSGKRLLSVVNSVIDLNKIEAGKMSVSCRPTHIRDMLGQITGMLTVNAAEKDVQLQVEVATSVPIYLYIDEDKISQIITNLTHNAIKFTPEGKWVKVYLLIEQQQLVITVVDQGVGISAHDQSKLFNKFQQVGQSKSNEGSGLGLSITKGLVDLLEGKINVSSVPKYGSSFEVTIPIVNNGANAIADEVENDQRVTFDTNRKILLVEDNKVNQAVMEAIFESLDVKIAIVATGEDAIEVTEKEDFDLIFMDLHLPGIDGYTAANTIKEKKPETPIVALSADAFNQSKTNNENHIWEMYLTKPLEIEKLVTVLNKVIPK